MTYTINTSVELTFQLFHRQFRLTVNLLRHVLTENVFNVLLIYHNCHNYDLMIQLSKL